MSKHKGLGRGLEALLGVDTSTAVTLEERERERPVQPPRELLLSRLQPGRYQPRTRMDETALQELAASISTHGMMQPIVVRPISSSATGGVDNGTQRYEIIAGERRFRAAAIAGMQSVPVIVKDVADELALALALIENIQREDLNPLEEAQAIRRLIDEFGYSHDKASEAIGRSRSATSNLLRLLNLAEPVQTMLLAGDLDMGHARALLALDRASQTMLAQQAIQKRMSVREIERAVSQFAASDGSPPLKRSAGAELSRDLARLQDRLADSLATSVKLQPDRRGGGKLVISFAGHEQFEGLLQRLGVSLSDE